MLIKKNSYKNACYIIIVVVKNMLSDTIEVSFSVFYLLLLLLGVQGIQDYAIISFSVARPSTQSGLTFLLRNEFIHQNVLRRNAKMSVAYITQCVPCTEVHIFFLIMTI